MSNIIDRIYHLVCSLQVENYHEGSCAFNRLIKPSDKGSELFNCDRLIRTILYNDMWQEEGREILQCS